MFIEIARLEELLTSQSKIIQIPLHNRSLISDWMGTLNFCDDFYSDKRTEES